MVPNAGLYRSGSIVGYLVVCGVLRRAEMRVLLPPLDELGIARCVAYMNESVIIYSRAVPSGTLERLSP